MRRPLLRLVALLPLAALLSSGCVTFRRGTERESRDSESLLAIAGASIPAEVVSVGDPRVAVRRTDGGLSVRLTVEERSRRADALRVVRSRFEKDGTGRVTVGIIPGIPQWAYQGGPGTPREEDRDSNADDFIYVPDSFHTGCNLVFEYPFVAAGINVCCVGLPTVFSLLGFGELGGLVGWNLWRVDEAEERTIGEETELLVRLESDPETRRRAFDGPVLATVVVPELALRRTIRLRPNEAGSANEGECPLPGSAPPNVSGSIVLSFPDRASAYARANRSLEPVPFPFPAGGAADGGVRAAPPPEVLDSTADPATPRGLLFFGTPGAEEVREAVRSGRPCASMPEAWSVLSWRASRLESGRIAFEREGAAGGRAAAAANRRRILEGLERLRALEDEYGAEADDLGGAVWRGARSALEGAAARFAADSSAQPPESVGRTIAETRRRLETGSTLAVSRRAFESLREAAAAWAPGFAFGREGTKDLLDRLEAVRTASPPGLPAARRGAEAALDGLERELVSELHARLARRSAAAGAARGERGIPALPGGLRNGPSPAGTNLLVVLFAPGAKARAERIPDVPSAVAAFVAATDESPLVRLAAVGRVADAALLEDLARHDADDEVRLSALGRIPDPRTRIDVARGDPRDGFRRRALSVACGAASLSDLARHDADASIRIDALALLEDDAVLGDIATSDLSADVRRAAAARVAPGPLLEDIARFDADAGVRLEAVRRLGDPAVLDEIAANDASPEVREAARTRRSELRR